MTEENGALICATLLDPKFKQLKFLPPKSDIKAYHNFAAKFIDSQKFVPTPAVSNNCNNGKENKKHFLSEDEDDSPLNSTLQEIKKYFDHPKMKPEFFYKQYGQKFSRLFAAAKIFLLSPAQVYQSSAYFLTHLFKYQNLYLVCFVTNFLIINIA